jgi:hypothetical protein
VRGRNDIIISKPTTDHGTSGVVVQQYDVGRSTSGGRFQHFMYIHTYIIHTEPAAT